VKAGFDVVSADGNPQMLAKAFENGRSQNLIMRTVQADWRWLSRDIYEKFDAVICVGNSFTHLFAEHDRRKSLAEFYSVLKHNGILILDHRNYDDMLDEGFTSKHTYYYSGDNVKAEPEYVDEGLARFRYEFPDNSVFHLNMFPLRKEYVRRLMTEVGFQRILTYADFQETYKANDPDFFIHIAEKEYMQPEKQHIDVDSYTESVDTTRGYYNDSSADRFYATVWGGEDIHIGVYENEKESIFDASRRTVERMAEKIPDLNEDTRVIDLGAGYGGSARYLAERFGCHVSCLNLSEVQNQRNREQNLKQGLQHLIEVVDGNFEDVPYSDNSFDVVWSQDAILHSADKGRVFQEVSRLLISGGTFIFTDPMQKGRGHRRDLQPVYDRLSLKFMGSVEYYRELAGKVGLEEVEVDIHPEQLVYHYSRVLQEINDRYDELAEVSDREYLERTVNGLHHWIENGKAGKLDWGIMVLRRK
jgi:glycine/sarcosine/dimethylglycine N-methyltransferase